MADKTMVDYTRKIKPYFEGVAPIEPTTTAASAHANNSIFYLDGTLVKATQAISIGDTIAVGTNVVAADDVETQIAGKEDNPVVLTSTLTAGATTLTFTNAAIGNNSRIRAYSDPFVLGLITDMVQSGTSVTLTCAEQASNVSVKLEIRN